MAQVNRADRKLTLIRLNLKWYQPCLMPSHVWRKLMSMISVIFPFW